MQTQSTEPAPISTRRPSRFGTIMLGLIAGFAGGLASPYVLAWLGRRAQPTMKALFVAGLGAYEKGREKAAELGEIASDTMAEARAEYDASVSGRAVTRGNGSEPLSGN